MRAGTTDHPENLAVPSGGSAGGTRYPPSVTYRQLLRRTVCLASALGRLGIGRGAVVGLMTPNRAEAMEAHYAVGGALRASVLNINWRLATDELAYLLQDAAVEWLVVDATFAPLVLPAVTAANSESGRVQAVVWLEDGTLPSADAIDEQSVPVSSHSYEDLLLSAEPSGEAALADTIGALGGVDSVAELPCEMYYTSGTSGRPKGVQLTHRIVYVHAIGCANEHRHHPMDVWVSACACCVVCVRRSSPTLSSPITFEHEASQHLLPSSYLPSLPSPVLPSSNLSILPSPFLPSLPSSYPLSTLLPSLPSLHSHLSTPQGHFAPLFHLVEAYGMFSIAAVGGSHVFVRGEPSFTAAAVLDSVERHGVTVSNVASAMVTMLLTEQGRKPRDMSSLELLSCGGSPLPRGEERMFDPASTRNLLLFYAPKLPAFYSLSFFVAEARPRIEPQSLRHTKPHHTTHHTTHHTPKSGKQPTPGRSLSHRTPLDCPQSSPHPTRLTTELVLRSLSEFGCEFFLSYGMTECCGKISMSLLDAPAVRSLTPPEQAENPHPPYQTRHRPPPLFL